jgi:hypothetical protein
MTSDKPAQRGDSKAKATQKRRGRYRKGRFIEFLAAPGRSGARFCHRCGEAAPRRVCAGLSAADASEAEQDSGGSLCAAR